MLLLAGADGCCPDGFDCVATPPSQRSTCQWTGRAIVPPATYQLSPDQKGPKRANATAATSNKPLDREPETQVQAAAETDTTLLSRQQTAAGVTALAACTAGFLCPQTTLVQAGQATCRRCVTQLGPGGRPLPASAMTRHRPQR